ncbi:MAG TPA: biosynthetic peptidoglycan transglycosylase [Actinomycetales bacterium]|nr:biosynthetic peptidoglycan transglycosylase [Actinomycetales bacterium]
MQAPAPAAPPRIRRRRVLRRAGLALLLLVALGFGALWLTTPSVGSVQQLVATRLAAEGVRPMAALPNPDRVGQALLATEDSRFYSTPGVDPISAVRAIGSFITNGRDSGGATLEQQLARNLYYPTRGGVLSKVDEAVVALKLDVSYSKADVLRMYLSAVYFGHGYYGLPAAAHGYFGTDPGRLTWSQASMIAGLVQAPSAYDPVVHLDVAKQRQRHVLDRLVAVGALTPAEADQVYRSPLGLR